MKTILKQKIIQLLDFNYPLSVNWRCYLIKRLIGEKVFIVYSDGKVGSTTLTGSLKKNFSHQFVFHIHRLTQQSILEAENYYKIRCQPSKIPDNVIQSIFLQNNLNHLYKSKEVYFFSLVRDPVAALISEYCENYPYTKQKNTNSEDEISVQITKNILNLFESNKVDLRLNWFEEELKKALDFDIYTEKFSSKKGYHIYRDRNLLILKLESLNNCYNQSMKDFLGLKDFTIEDGNKAESSIYSGIYKNVKKSIRFPDEILNKIYSSKYVQYFYEEEEIKNFKARWRE